MRVELKKLTLKNFKGTKEKEVIFSDKTNISGDNATGKTTIFDAYTWLLWGKDSYNRKDYEIKPYDENNNVIHNLESSVEGVFDIDGKETTFTRVYKEVWTKKRGSNTETFTGNTTDFYINEVPLKKKEYEDRISELVSEDEFNLLSNPRYFNEILDKKERRKILLSLVKDVNIDDVKEANKELEDLDLSNYTIEEIQAMAKSTCKKINDKLKEIPARIDELEATKTTEDFKKLEKDKEEIKKKINEIDKELAGLSSVSEKLDNRYDLIVKYKKSIETIKDDFEKYKKEKARGYEEEAQDIKQKESVINFEIDNSKSRIKNLESVKEHYTERVKDVEEEIQNLRKKYLELYNRKFDGSLNCPTCGKEFDPDKKEEILKHFNLDKSKKLEACKAEAESLKTGAENTKEKISDYDNEISDLKAKIENLSNSKMNNQKSLKDLQVKIDEINNLEMTQEDKEKIKAFEGEIAKTEAEISDVNKIDTSSILDQKDSYNDKLESINKELSKKGLNAELDKKIAQYMEDEKELSKQFEEKQRDLYLCDEYIRTYTNLVSDKINNLFTYIEFKLFDIQINGGIQETAEATYKGVPYGSLNSAAKINAGLDVIKSLSRHYDKQIPVFVDNAESINDIAETNSQLITLSVSKFKNIRVENL
ncbi:MAG: AAA family ATPase [Finegoldia sp.]|nr:AAA family ATPase [Finegoldia sp.]